MKFYTLYLLSLFLIICGCGFDNERSNSSADSDYESPAENQISDAGEVALELESNDEMRYDKSLLRVKAGQRVTLVLKHTGELQESLMGHNFVLLKKGTNIDDFAAEAVAATGNDYIPESSNAIIAHTEMIGGGEQTSVSFTAPSKGAYDYICTFPGHYGLMRGKFIVE
ncbi:MAG: azurin [Bacteroidota bacterium]